MNGLDLFSGIGGIALGLQEFVRPIAYCEQDPYAQAVLLSRMQSGDLPNAPIWDDVRTLRASDLPQGIDIITGGFPCQDISCAGRGKGLEGKRSGLFFEVMRLAQEIQPKFVFLENVPAIRVRGLGTVVEELANIGYDARWHCLSAQEIGAPHKRNRWWCLATNTMRQRLEGQREITCRTCSQQHHSCNEGWWSAEPRVDRMAHGVSNRVDRLRGLGNAVVPAQAKQAFRELMGLV